MDGPGWCTHAQRQRETNGPNSVLFLEPALITAGVQRAGVKWAVFKGYFLKAVLTFKRSNFDEWNNLPANYAPPWPTILYLSV